MQFEWNATKAKTNHRKHRVSFEELPQFSAIRLQRFMKIPAEGRYLLIGTSASRRLLIVAFAERRDRIRVINARRVTKREREMYEKENR